ncbi:MAG: monovalent cation/H+ antiporter complex subunit F [Firmicutes bacterium]|nr:monovalent cation/H+ antiporter complex subunit F [Bacillota bacterium]
MQIFFELCLLATILLSIPILVMLLKKGGFYNHFAAILAVSTNVTLFLLLIGFIDSRHDMYVDIALSFAVLGFVSSVIVAKFMSGGGDKDDDGN